MNDVMADPLYGAHGFAAELAALDAAGVLVPSADPEAPGGPVEVDETDWFDDTSYEVSRVDAFECQQWAGADQDEAERTLLAARAPAWVSLPPGGDLAAALEQVRIQTESPMALIEVMKAAVRLSSWAESVKLAAMASFDRQRQAQAADVPRPAQLDAYGRPVDPQRSRAAEIACALRLSPTTVYKHVDTALRLTSTLSATHSALRCGALTVSKAISIADATDCLTPYQAQAVEAHVLKRAPAQTHANLRASLRRRVAKVNARSQAERHRAAVAERRCRVVPLEDGMAGLWVVHTADKIQQMYVVIQAMADLAKRDYPNPTAAMTVPTVAEAHTTRGADSTDSANTTHDNWTAVAETDAGEVYDGTFDDAVTDDGTPKDSAAGDGCRADSRAEGNESSKVSARDSPASDGRTDDDRIGEQRRTGDDRSAVKRQTGDDRSAEQRRADVVADLFEHMLHNGLDWLGRRLPDQHRRKPHIEVTIPATTLLGLDNNPCELTGYGPISADLARRIAADGTWRRLLTDPTHGTVLEASTTRHDPSTLVSETLIARYPTCVWPGCNRPARECDRDHTTSFTRTGETRLGGLGMFCEYHHVIKDTPQWGWRATNNPDRSITLISPTGHRYTTVPPARGAIANPSPAPGPITNPSPARGPVINPALTDPPSPINPPTDTNNADNADTADAPHFQGEPPPF